MTRILVIDDEPILRAVMLETLEQAGHDVVGADGAERALTLLEDESIGLVVSDIVMPRLSGMELLETIQRHRPSVPVLLVTGADTYANLSGALAGGAAGLVVKPISPPEFLRAVDRALDRASRTRSDWRQRMFTPTLAGALANAIEAREASLHGHCERLAGLADRLGAELGLNRSELETLRLGAILHDIGKIAIPDRILLKPGPLAGDERVVMTTHPAIGDRMLLPLELLDGVRAAVRHHHERWDGKGYPDGLAGLEIPLLARIVSVADGVEAMSANRAYRRALTRSEIVRELEQGRASQWDPVIVDAALCLIHSGELRVGSEGLVLLEAA
jgi:response regulator RpfG family c-di-GMP phosphodiesterase